MLAAASQGDRADVSAPRKQSAGLSASQSVDAAELHILLAEMQTEFCAHSWKKVPVDIAPQDLLDWENSKRPTTIQYYYQPGADDGRPVLVAAASVASAMRHNSPVSGFPILARCYVRPRFRGAGLYRKILQHRLSTLVQQDGARLKAIHMGTTDARVARTIADRSLPWNGFVQVGWEDLSLGAETVRVGGYLLFSPDYAKALLRGALKLTAPLGGLTVREALESLLAGRWSGPTDPYSWCCDILSANPTARSVQSVSPIRELVEFCAQIPLIYTPGAQGASGGFATRNSPAVETIE